MAAPTRNAIKHLWIQAHALQRWITLYCILTVERTHLTI